MHGKYTSWPSFEVHWNLKFTTFTKMNLERIGQNMICLLCILSIHWNSADKERLNKTIFHQTGSRTAFIFTVN